MAEDWFADVRKYDSGADENVVRKIVTYLGIALRKRDSSLVSFSDPQEIGRVRQNYLRKKLGLTDSDDKLDAGLDWVKGLMSADRTKNRVTVYYLLAHYFGKLDLFGGAAGTSASSLGAAPAAIGATGLAAAGGATASTTPSSASVTSPRSEATPSSATPSPLQPAHAGEVEESDRGSSGWPKWLTWLLIAIAVIVLFFILRSCMAEKQNVTTNLASTSPTATSPAAPAANASIATTSAATAVPTGAGVVSGEKDSKPMLTVYFDTGKSEVSKDMAGAATALKAYLDAHPGSKLAVSGYNDPSGNAALNAELSKKRAQAVAAGLKSAGIPEGVVKLVKPADTTTSAVTPEQARRVEVTVQQ